MYCLPDILDLGQVTNYFCRVPLVMYSLYTTTTQMQGLNARLVGSVYFVIQSLDIKTLFSRINVSMVT